MFDHVTIRASDRAAAERFYDTVLRPLGIEKDHSGELYTERGDFSLGQADDEKPITRDYGAFVLDPDGNNVELVNHNRG